MHTEERNRDAYMKVKRHLQPGLPPDVHMKRKQKEN